MSFAVPDYLRHRQFVLGLLGYYLRLAPTNRTPLHELTTLIAREIMISQLARWPAAAVGWVSPASNLSPRPRSVPRERQRSRKPVKPPPHSVRKSMRSATPQGLILSLFVHIRSYLFFDSWLPDGWGERANQADF
ncbi:hypothetical protein [Caballeronia sordidicola]|uniref:hypothetical protein n=1 Tax=Caballeronia sordidicola TaxID=196367 RepID=UPI001177562A|nr:hypothetical protein [Caballeronia sordidicola]